MKLLEFQAHELLSRFAIPCSSGCVVASAADLAARAADLTYPIVIKAQVQTGGRGKASSVKIAANDVERIAMGGKFCG